MRGDFRNRPLVRAPFLKASFGLACCAMLAAGCVREQPAPAELVRVDTLPAHRITSFRPQHAIGATVDRQPAGAIPAIYSRRNVRAMLEAGLGWLSYRLFTELSVQDWHWDPSGTFSAGDQGYWTSGASPAAPITSSFGYRLPHRGATTDQGSNEDYSRLDDGDPTTYWKSNPYLTSAFTGEPDSEHPQWAMVDLGSPQFVNAIRIVWMNPYATRYSIQYWPGRDAIAEPDAAKWTTFPTGKVEHGTGGVATLRLTHGAVKVRFVRVLMTQSSNTCDAHGSSDRRNCVGYAIGEIYVGMLERGGGFGDLVKHNACGGERPGAYACGLRQSTAYVSSTDPWHRAADRVSDVEQPGLDLIAGGGLTRSLPATYAVPMLYSTPENAVAEIRYVRARGYPISFVELGAQPDDQYVEPEDYGALYIQWARALHAFDPGLKLGGPVFSGVNSDVTWWADSRGQVSWLRRFLTYLRSHGRMADLAFMTFEHYPVGGCPHGDALQHILLKEPALVKGIIDTWHADGIPTSVPLYITQAGFSSANSSQVPMQIEGALWLADYLGSALANHVSGAVYYQYEPVPLGQNPQCPADWGSPTMFVTDKRSVIRARAAQFYAAEMIMHEWLAAGDGEHQLYPAATNVVTEEGPLITAYAVHRPDGLWSVMLVNKDVKAHVVQVNFANASRVSSFGAAVASVSFGSAQYQWQANGAASLPQPDDPPLHKWLAGGSQATYEIPAQSITVLRGHTRPAVP